MRFTLFLFFYVCPRCLAKRSTQFVKVLTEPLSNKWVTQYKAGTESFPGGASWILLPACCRERGCLTVWATLRQWQEMEVSWLWRKCVSGERERERERGRGGWKCEEAKTGFVLNASYFTHFQVHTFILGVHGKIFTRFNIQKSHFPQTVCCCSTSIHALSLKHPPIFISSCLTLLALCTLCTLAAIELTNLPTCSVSSCWCWWRVLSETM